MEGVAPGGDTSVLYLYGFVPASSTLPVIEGIETRARVFLVTHGEVACAVSLVPASGYADSKGHPARDAEWLAARAVRHHEVIAALHAAGPVLPLKFGVVCRSTADAGLLLQDLGASLPPLFADLLDKDEWTLRISVDMLLITARHEAESASLIAFIEQERVLTDGRAYFARKQRAAATAALVAKTFDAIETDVCARLGALDLKAVRSGRPVGVHPDASRALSLLVPRDVRDRLDAALVEMQDAHAASGLAFELVGPWPPYSFAPPLESRLGRE